MNSAIIIRILIININIKLVFPINNVENKERIPVPNNVYSNILEFKKDIILIQIQLIQYLIHLPLTIFQELYIFL